MRRTNIKGLSLDNIRLEGSVFTAEIVEKAASGKAPKQVDADYRIPRGLRLLDEIGRSYKIAKELWKNLEEGELSERHFSKEFFMDALSYPLTLFEKLVNIDLKGSSTSSESTASWYIICDKNSLRLVRKSISLARPSYLEFDIPAILKENRFSEYQMLYRIMHGSRTEGLDNDGKGECVWDIWKKAGEELGVRVREGLRKGVTRALSVLGRGFLNYNSSGNDELRYAFETGELSEQGYYQELLRLIYRFLFIITVEERKLIFEHLPETERTDLKLYEKHTLYEKGYSLHRLRERCARYRTTDNYCDLWEGIKIVFLILGGEGQPNNPLDLPVLDGLFKADQCPHLDKCGLSNANLLEAMYLLRWTVEDNVRTLIDYKNMGSEELGSVYESLLEMIPQVDIPRHSFGFLGIDVEGSPSGNSRKTSGSYYTHASRVECLIKGNLDPLIDEKLTGNNEAVKEQKLLSITVIDPACGSGHFLLAAARRLADRLAFLRANGNPVDDALYRKSLHDVISSCIYGVDVNPMAVELARMALWLEGHEPGKPLSFLDHHIRCGNSLVGVMDFGVLSKGIPDDAYKVLSGDDTECVSFYKKRNKNERDNKANTGMDLFEEPIKKAMAELTVFHWKLENIQNNNLADVEEKRTLFDRLLQSHEYCNLKTACDLYVSAFYAVKTGKEPPHFSFAPTNNDVQRASAGLTESQFSEGVNALAAQIAEENNFFHWRLEFPEVFQKEGFDCVLANPPWERIKLQDKEFFASILPDISGTQNASRRADLIIDLQNGNEYERGIYTSYIQASRRADATSSYVHVDKAKNGRFPLSGTGDVNLYALFTETILQIMNPTGRAGLVVPSGLATTDTTKLLFDHLIITKRLKSFFEFENEGFFPDVEQGHAVTFALTSVVGWKKESITSVFLFQGRDLKELGNQDRVIYLTAEDINRVNPNTHTCPIFYSSKDADITKLIYRNVPILFSERNSINYDANMWNISFFRMYDMSNDSGKFLTKKELLQNDYALSDNHFIKGIEKYLPVYESKMMFQYDHRYGDFNDVETGRHIHILPDIVPDRKKSTSYVVEPHYWIQKNAVLLELEKRNITIKWHIGWRSIADARASARTVIASIIPFAGVGNNITLGYFDSSISAIMKLCFFANMNSLVLDFIARQKVGGNNLNMFYVKQFPIIPPSAYSQDDLDFIVPRVLELSYTAVDLIPFTEDLWDSADSRMRRLFLEQRHGKKAVAFEEFINYDTTYLSVNAKSLKKQVCLSDLLPPFVFDPEKRSLLRASLDARYARLYGLSRDDLRYILDPADLMGLDYPSETFRVLKEKEIAEYGEYRTQRLVLEAWDGEGE
jgi:hypothetical protein